MNKNKIDFFDETVYEEKLDNGLNVYILPNKNVEDAFVTFTSKYGGCNLSFSINNKNYNVPNGIAHFLEHKMFEQKSGADPFMFFGKSGTYCNAMTNYYNTSYVFAGNKNFNENLNFLLDFVQNPYFTDENVLKEKGIIKEEIKMYEDMPDRTMYEKILYNMFNKHPIKYSIGGNISDIESITKENLYDVYTAYYNPSNMFVVITGNVDVDNCINIIKENQEFKKLDNINVKSKEIKETDAVAKEYEELVHNVSIPYVAYGIKIPVKKFKNIDIKLRNMYLSTIFNILFDDTSLFYENAKKMGILDTEIEIESIDTREHKIFVLLFKSKKYKEAIEYIDKTLGNIEILESDLERKKRVYISQILYILDDISESNRVIVNDIVLYNKLYSNIYELISNMNINDLRDIASKMNVTNKSILVIKNE